MLDEVCEGESDFHPFDNDSGGLTDTINIASDGVLYGHHQRR
ncbi:MAG: hypothetical protein R2795_19990 [Saprospiraceae bacterium]